MNASMICEAKYQSNADMIANNCVFIIEFESDLRLWVGYTSTRVLKSKIDGIITNAYSSNRKDYNSDLSRSIRASKYINVSILCTCNSNMALLKKKYEAIKKYNTLCPNGANDIALEARDLREKDMVKLLVENDTFFNLAFNNLHQRCRSIKSLKVAQIEKDTHRRVRIWDSVSQVARDFGVSQGNISACCRGRIKSAYGFHWEYVEAD